MVSAAIRLAVATKRNMQYDRPTGKRGGVKGVEKVDGGRGGGEGIRGVRLVTI